MSLLAATTCMTSTADKARNIAQALDLVEQAAEAGADWVLLPEVFTYHGPYDVLSQMAEPDQGPLYHTLAELAGRLGIVLFAGSFAVLPDTRSADNRVYNRMYVFDREGKEIGRYTKSHLFNLVGPNGEHLYCESDGYIAGDETQTIMIDGFHVGLTICYDLRFSGLYQKLTRQTPIDVFINAAAFTKATGQAHWELLLRARSVEWQAYSIAANQTGTHSPGKESYGHSMIIDPWGEMLADTGVRPGFVLAEIDRVRIEEVRRQLPALDNRRPELY